MSGDAVVAGRLEIPVEANLGGFKEKLKAAVEKAAEEAVANIDVKIDAGGPKQTHEPAADEAAARVTAKIGVDVNASTLKAKLEAAAKSAGQLKIGTHVSSIAAALKQNLAAAQAQANSSPVNVPIQGKRSNRFLSWLRAQIAKGQVMANANPITIPTQQGSAGGGGGGLFGGGGKGGGPNLPDWAQSKGARSSFRPLMYLGIASVIQPAIAAIVGSLGGLVAMASSAAASLNVLGGAGGVLAALGAGFAAVTISVRTLMEGKLEDLPKSLQGVRKEVDASGEAWAGMREKIAVSFWSQLDGQIKSTADAVLPLLRDGLSGVATELGETAKQTAQWMKSPLFKKQTASIFQTMKGVTDGFGHALLGLLKGFVNITQAAGPMLGKFGDVMRNFGDWAASIGDSEQKQKNLGVAFEYAWSKAAQLWDIAKNLGATLKAMFSAGRASGDSLLGSLQDVVKEWRNWAESTEGQERIKRWFENVEPIARAAGRLIADLGKAIARLAEDGTTAGLLEKIRTELLPSLETFLRNLGTTLGPAVITFITNVLEVLTQMSAAGSPLGQGLEVINKIIGGLASIFQANPALATNVGILLGALLGFRALTFFSSLIPGLAGLTKFIGGGGKAAWLGAAGGIALFSGALSGLPGPVQGAWAAVSTLLTLVPSIQGMSGQSKGIGLLGTAVQNMGTKFSQAKAPVGGFRGTMAGLSASIGYVGSAAGKGVMGAAKGLMGLLGGPWGLALTAASTAVGYFIGKQQEAAAKVDALSATMDKQTGKFTEASQTNIRDGLLGDLSPEDAKLLQDLGVNFNELADAALKGGPAYEEQRQKLVNLMNEHQGITSLFSDESMATEGLLRSFERAGDAAEGSRIKQEVLNKVNKEGADTAGSLGTGMKNAAGQIAGAVFPTENLADALERITGVTLSARSADRQYEEAKKSLSEAVQKGDKVVKDSTGAVTNATEAGRRYNERLDSMASAAVDKAEADLKAGRSVAEVTAKMTASRSAFIENARRLGYSESAANNLADQLGLTTTKVGILGSKINGLPDSHYTTIGVRNLASSVISAIGGQIGRLSGTMINIGASFGWRHGGIQEFMEGGIRGLNSYALGKLPREAMIARDGANLVQWAESGTGGEAFIPLGAQNRPRSIAILEEVARRFGMALAPVAGALGRAAAPNAGALVPALGPGAFGALGAASGRAAPNVTFQEGAFQINNPAPEPASRDAASALRSVGESGLFGWDD